jgi:hypothetical protein
MEEDAYQYILFNCPSKANTQLQLLRKSMFQNPETMFSFL